jgi:hypothetical protein
MKRSNVVVLVVVLTLAAAAAVGVAFVLALGMFLPRPPQSSFLAAAASDTDDAFFPSFTDYGPFQGVVRDSPPGGARDQSFELEGGLLLEVWNRGERDRVPTVQLRTAEGSTRWRIYAKAGWLDGVESIRFGEFDVNDGGIAVSGMVDWKHGQEHTVWYLELDGDLEQYWFSW